MLPVSGRGGPATTFFPLRRSAPHWPRFLRAWCAASMLEELSSDYVRTARAKGLSTGAVLFRHAFRNALIPIITILGLQFGTLLAGTIVTETIFSWPGIGRLTVQAISSRDYPLLQGCILVIAVSYVVVNLLTDLLYTRHRSAGAALLSVAGLAAAISSSKHPGSRRVYRRSNLDPRRAARSMDRAGRSRRAKSADPLSSSFARSLDGHRRTGPRHSFADNFRRARFSCWSRFPWFAVAAPSACSSECSPVTPAAGSTVS